MQERAALAPQWPNPSADGFGPTYFVVTPAHDAKKKAGRAGTRPAQNYPPSSPELDWNFFLNFFGGITNLD